MCLGVLSESIPLCILVGDEDDLVSLFTWLLTFELDQQVPHLYGVPINDFIKITNIYTKLVCPRNTPHSTNERAFKAGKFEIFNH